MSQPSLGFVGGADGPVTVFASGGGTALLVYLVLINLVTFFVYGADKRRARQGKWRVPEKTLFIITTDGCENASHRYSYETVHRMIERQKTKYGWEFLFLGANIDAAKEAARFGIAAERAVNYKCDEMGTALNYDVISEAICTVRAKKTLGAGWKRRIDADVQKRGR